MAIIKRPEGYMENPYKGHDGRDYHSAEALRHADEEYDRRMYRKIRVEKILIPNRIDKSLVKK